jgi:hypothetical protein
VRISPILPWQEPADLAYHVVELPASQEPRGTQAFPPLTWTAHPIDEQTNRAIPREEPDAAAYPMESLPAEDQVEERNRRLREARIMDLLVLPAGHQRRLVRRPTLRRETHWYQCLQFPLRAFPRILGLAAALGTATPWLLALFLHREELGLVGLLLSPIGLVIPLTVLVYACGFLDGVLKGALAGDVPNVVWRWQILAALRSTGRWLFCFLAGPAVLAGIALDYWIHCGEMDLLDQLILAELFVAAVGYGLFALLAVTRTDRLRDANPWRIADLARCLGYRSVLAVVLASGLAWLDGWLLLEATATLHLEAFGGWLLLIIVWMWVLASTTFMFRMVGLWCFRALLPIVFPVAVGERQA